MAADGIECTLTWGDFYPPPWEIFSVDRETDIEAGFWIKWF